MRRTNRLSAAVLLGATAALGFSIAVPASTLVPAALSTEPAVEQNAPIAEQTDGSAFHRLATLPAEENSNTDGETVAEISTVSTDGNTVIYTDAAAGGVGFVDITDPDNPQADGFYETEGEPTSVFATEDYLMVVVDISVDYTDPQGTVFFLDPEDHTEIAQLDLGGQPDSIDVTADGSTAFIAMENERDEEFGDGGLPQMPAGTLARIDLTVPAENLAVEHLDLTGLDGLDTPEDPEPEFVKVSPDDTKVAVTLQENNGVVIVDTDTGEVLNHFNAGAVSVENVDTAEDGNLLLNGVVDDAVREPDAIGWIDNDHVATANEGDWTGGSRGWSIFEASTGEVVWDAGNTFEHIGHRYGQYPEHRSEDKGTEPEGLAVETFGDTRYAFVGSERGNFVAVYDVTDPAEPVFTQMLPSTNGPEGLLPIPERDLLVISSEEDDASVGMRATVQVYQLDQGTAETATLKSADDGEGLPITWSALSALTAVPGQDDLLYAAPDNFLTPSRIYSIDTAPQQDGGPAIITDQMIITNEGEPSGYDVEGVWADEDGTFWLAVEGTAGDGDAGTVGNMLVHVNAEGEVLEETAMPDDVAAGLGGQGFEGVTGYGIGEDAVLYAAVQRSASQGPENVARIGQYTVATGEWQWFGYPLEGTDTESDWIGLSEITAVDHDTLAVIERDKLTGPDAELKAINTVDIPENLGDEELPVAEKQNAIDVLPELRSLNGWTQEKLEGLAIAGNGNVYTVTDNDGADEASGETMFLNHGAAEDHFTIDEPDTADPSQEPTEPPSDTSTETPTETPTGVPSDTPSETTPTVQAPDGGDDSQGAAVSDDGDDPDTGPVGDSADDDRAGVLADTGASIGIIVAAAAALALVGIGGVMFARRRA